MSSQLALLAPTLATQRNAPVVLRSIWKLASSSARSLQVSSTWVPSDRREAARSLGAAGGVP